MTIFQRIINGDLPSYKIYEDDLTYSFLALDQVQLGHTLVVPKVVVDHFFDVPEPHFSAVFSVAKKLAPSIRKATGCTRVGTAIVGFEVPHFHLHLIPMYGVHDMDFRKGRQLEKEQMIEIQKKILSELNAH